MPNVPVPIDTQRGQRPRRATSAASGTAGWSIALLCCGALLLGAGCGERTAVAPDVEPGTHVDRGESVQARRIEAALHARINALRADFQLAPLGWNESLLPIARRHSADMAHRDYFDHRNPDGLGPIERYAASGFRCRVPITSTRFATGGENIAQSHVYIGYRVLPGGRREPYGARSATEIAERIATGWMNSPSHRDNLLRAYWRTEAIGVFVDSQGRVFATQNFC